MALEEIKNIIEKEGWLFEKVYGAVITAARDVLNEDDSTANHASRIAWARAMFSGSPDHYHGECKKFYRLLMSYPDNRAATQQTADSVIQNAVNGVIDTVAGM